MNANQCHGSSPGGASPSTQNSHAMLGSYNNQEQQQQLQRSSSLLTNEEEKKLEEQ